MNNALTEEIRSFLAEPNPAIVATVRPDGQPVSVATWYLFDGGRVLLNMDARRKRLEYLREDPRVSLTVLAAGDWYAHVSLQGRVTELVDDEDLVDIDRLAQHYGMDRYWDRKNPRVSAWVTIDHVHAWGKVAPSDGESE